MNGHDRKGSGVATSRSGDFPNPFGDLNCQKRLETKLFWKTLALTPRHFVHFTKWCGSSSLVHVLNEQQGPAVGAPQSQSTLGVSLWFNKNSSSQVYIDFSCSLLIFLSLVSQKMSKEKNEPSLWSGKASSFLRHITPIICRLQNMQMSWSCHLITTNNLKGVASGWSWSLHSHFQKIWEETLHKHVWMISFIFSSLAWRQMKPRPCVLKGFLLCLIKSTLSLMRELYLQPLTTIFVPDRRSLLQRRCNLTIKYWILG